MYPSQPVFQLSFICRTKSKGRPQMIEPEVLVDLLVVTDEGIIPCWPKVRACTKAWFSPINKIHRTWKERLDFGCGGHWFYFSPRGEMVRCMQSGQRLTTVKVNCTLHARSRDGQPHAPNLPFCQINIPTRDGTREDMIQEGLSQDRGELIRFSLLPQIMSRSCCATWRHSLIHGGGVATKG